MKTALLSFAACIMLAACNPEDPETHRPAADRHPRAEREAPEEERPQAAADPTAESVTPAPATVPKGLPFVGKRIFETRPAVTGTGTPHRFVEILPNGDVFFQYGQQNANTGTTMTGERVYAGRFRRVMTCSFEKLGDTRYYILGRNTITEVDAQGQKLSSEDCCPNDKVDMTTACPCEGSLYDPGTGR